MKTSSQVAISKTMKCTWIGLTYHLYSEVFKEAGPGATWVT